MVYFVVVVMDFLDYYLPLFIRLGKEESPDASRADTRLWVCAPGKGVTFVILVDRRRLQAAQKCSAMGTDRRDARRIDR